MTVLRGMTWDHRRAVDPLTGTLDAFRVRHPGIDIEWSARPLEGFEFTPVCELARDYDLIVLDHPFAGDIAAGACLEPLDDLVSVETANAFVGPSLETYRYEGRLWAAPIDAACQVAVSRPDLLDELGAPPPVDWSQVVELGRRARARGKHLAIALKGVHALMTFFTLCANLGRPCAIDPSQPLVSPETARAALGHMRELLELCPPDVFDWNSIALHDAMAGRDDLVFCPAVYCYATYAEADHRRPLRFHDLPGPLGPHGSAIGGTGMGISRRCRDLAAARAYVGYLMEAGTQEAFAHHHGQPARIEPWESDTLDARFGGCFTATRATMEAAWIRPRYSGYLRIQAIGGGLVEAYLRGDLAESALLDRLRRLHSEAGRARS